MKESIRHQIVVNMPYKLVHFLIENKCYSQYVTNVVHYINHWRINPINMLRKMEDKYAIVDSFTWAFTKEYYNYWYNIHKKYYEQETRCSKVS